MIPLLVAELLTDGRGAFSDDGPFGGFFAKKPKIEGCVLFEALELCFLSTGGGRAGVESAVTRPLTIFWRYSLVRIVFGATQGHSLY